MIQYNIQVNQGNEALGSGKSITANEVVQTCDTQFLAHHIHLHNALIPEQVAAAVLENFGKTAAELMAAGFAIQFKSGEDVIMRIYPDIHVKGGNINLQRAQQLKPGTTDLTTENASELVRLAGGVTLRARAEVEQKFTELLMAENPSVEHKGVIEKAYVNRADGTGGGGGGQQGGGSDDNGGGDNGGGSLEG